MDESFLKELKQSMDEIPFGESKFQIEKLIVSHQSDERNLRQVLLQINARLNALNEAKFKRRRLEIDLKEKISKIELSNGFDKERLKIDIEEIEYKLNNEEKFIKDALIELNYYYEIFKKLPKVTRDQFESSEKEYWINRLMADAKSEFLSTTRISVGTIQSLNKIGANINFIADKNDYMIEFKDNNLIEQKEKEI